MNGKPWTQDDLAKVRRLVDQGLEPREVARSFPGRSEHAVVNVIYQRTPYLELKRARKKQIGHDSRPWSAAEDMLLVALRREEPRLGLIAARMGRTIDSLKARLAHLRVEKDAHRRPAHQRRACMCCRRSFISEGPHNRLCTTCRALSADPSDATYSVSVGHRAL